MVPTPLSGVFRAIGIGAMATLMWLPAVAVAEDGALPAKLQGAISREIDAAFSRNERCLSGPAINEILQSNGRYVVALVAYASDLMAQRPEWSAYEACRCLRTMALTTASAQPDQASPVHLVLRRRFPQCSEVIAGAIEHTLADLPPATRAQRIAGPAPLAAGIRRITCSDPGSCFSIEPDPSTVRIGPAIANVATKTHR